MNNDIDVPVAVCWSLGHLVMWSVGWWAACQLERSGGRRVGWGQTDTSPGQPGENSPPRAAGNLTRTDDLKTNITGPVVIHGTILEYCQSQMVQEMESTGWSFHVKKIDAMGEKRMIMMVNVTYVPNLERKFRMWCTSVARYWRF